MSIYRTIDGLKRGGIDDEKVEMITPGGVDAGGPQAEPEPHRPGLIPEPDWTKLRRAVPVTELMPGTLRWAANLPSELRPQALLAKYPRVANLVAACWKEPESFHMCVEGLVVVTGRRVKRRGFPDDVLGELVNLQTHNYLQRYAPILARQRASEPDDKDAPA